MGGGGVGGAADAAPKNSSCSQASDDSCCNCPGVSGICVSGRADDRDGGRDRKNIAPSLCCELTVDICVACVD